jgi:hypothetical protein
MTIPNILRQFDLKEGDFPKGSKFVQSGRFGDNALVVIVPKGTELPMLGFKTHVMKTIDGVWFEEAELPGQKDKPEPLRDYAYLRWQN